MHRVQKLLSNYGHCSRRKAEELIREGRVKVNDKLISLGDQASEEDQIYVDNKLVHKEKKRYLILNKPLNCVTALEDQHNKTVMKFIKIKERVFPIGRLDINTTGLLLFTNDGDFANQIMHPSHEIKKTYRVELNKSLEKEDIQKIERGVVLEDGKTSRAKVKHVKSNILEITIHEGKNRIIRRIMEELGYLVISLERIRIGTLCLGNLKLGAFRDLSEEEKKKVFE